MYEVAMSSKFKKDLKALKNSGRYNLNDLKYVVKLLASGDELPVIYQDHQLKGEKKNFRECHIKPDWLMIYQKHENKLILTLVRTGNHAKLLNL